MCHVNSNDNTVCSQHPPCACRCSIISPRLWQDPRFAGTRIPACLPQPQIMKTRLGSEIAHLHFLLIFPFQRKNERSWGRGRKWVWGQAAASVSATQRPWALGKAPGSMLQSSDPKPEENRQPEMPRVQNLDALVRGGALD